MAVNAAFLTAAAGAAATAYPYLALHTAQPDASGSNQAASARVAASWVNTNGILTITSKSFTGGAASGPVTHVGYWSASTAGTFGGWHALTGDQTFNAAGQYTINGDTITFSGT